MLGSKRPKYIKFFFSVIRSVRGFLEVAFSSFHVNVDAMQFRHSILKFRLVFEKNDYVFWEKKTFANSFLKILFPTDHYRFRKEPKPCTHKQLSGQKETKLKRVSKYNHFPRKTLENVHFWCLDITWVRFKNTAGEKKLLVSTGYDCLPLKALVFDSPSQKMRFPENGGFGVTLLVTMNCDNHWNWHHLRFISQSQVRCDFSGNGSGNSTNQFKFSIPLVEA